MSTDDKEAPELRCISVTVTPYVSLPLTHNTHTVLAYATVLPSGDPNLDLFFAKLLAFAK